MGPGGELGDHHLLRQHGQHSDSGWLSTTPCGLSDARLKKEQPIMIHLHRPDGGSEPRKFKAVTRSNVEQLPQWERLNGELREAIDVVSRVLPFRTNRYLVDRLIDWDRVPDDPMYQLTFPQRGMLTDDHYEEVARLVRAGANKAEIDPVATRIRYELNPHPAGQMTDNVPQLDGRPLDGMQHKYRETVLFFPSHGQTCHAYCTFCFRWAQFVGLEDLRFASKEADVLRRYVLANPQVTDVLITGGDPMVMKTKVLRRYVEPLLDLEQLISIRIGTKAVAYWPHRFVTDDDADDLMTLFEQVVQSGKQLALMGHYTHPVELSTRIAQRAVRRIRETGANVRMQSPVVRHVNDDAAAWTELWKRGVRLGAVPYYMFVERDTGARGYFEMPLIRCWDIFRGAYQRVSGLARTVRGPSMSAHPGKVHVVGVQEVGGEKVFVLEYLQARRPELVRRPFFARFDPTASWFDQLEPARAQDRPFFAHLDKKTDVAPRHPNGGASLTIRGDHGWMSPRGGVRPGRGALPE
jgi:KamA family protein